MHLREIKPMVDGVIIMSNGHQYYVDLEHINELDLQFKEGLFRINTGTKEKYVLDGYATGDIISAGRLSDDEMIKHGLSSNREFKSRMTGRLKDIETHILDVALNEYEAALSSVTGKGMDVLPYWAEKFNVKATTVRGWLVKHRAFRKIKPATFGDLLKAAGAK